MPSAACRSAALAPAPGPEDLLHKFENAADRNGHLAVSTFRLGRLAVVRMSVPGELADDVDVGAGARWAFRTCLALRRRSSSGDRGHARGAAKQLRCPAGFGHSRVAAATSELAVPASLRCRACWHYRTPRYSRLPLNLGFANSTTHRVLAPRRPRPRSDQYHLTRRQPDASAANVLVVTVGAS